MTEPRIVLVPTDQGETIRPGRIRDLWAGKLPATGTCGSCDQALDAPHLKGCRYPGKVGENAEEWYL